MNHEIVKVRKELFAGKDVEKNLPCYLSGLAGVYYRMANYNLAMQYTAFSEGIRDGEWELPEHTKGYAGRLEEMVRCLAFGKETAESAENALKCLEEMRKELTAAMQTLTAYTDCLYLHEYALCRLAPGMEGTVEEIDSNAALEEISSFLFCDEEQEGLLARVSAVVSELPVRMTKAKFFEWIETTLAAYKESDSDTLDRVFYMLYSAAGLYKPGEAEQFAKCKEVLAYLQAMDYRTLTEEQYKEAKEKLTAVTEYIGMISDVYFSLTELVNSLFTIYLTESYVTLDDVAEVKCCEEVYRLLLEGKDDTDFALVEAFESFEGKPEEIEEFLFREEGYFDELPVDEKLLEAMMQKALYVRVSYARRLHTTSIFVELEQEAKRQMTYEDALTAFCETVSKALEEGQRATNRALMARVIQNLPLPFTKKSDIQKYILASLENCHDMSEKTAAIRAIRELAEGM